MRNLGKRVKEFRLSKEMSQPAAAEALGISLATIQRIESGAKGSDLTRARIEKRLERLVSRESIAA